MTNESDELAWNEAVKDVQKLKQPSTFKPVLKKNTHHHSLSEPTPVYKNYAHKVDLNTPADIDKNTLKRFKREEFGIEASLDLHGMTIDQAYTAVKNFIISSYNQNKRAIIIVTGKGLMHQDEDIFQPKGVLKQSVPEWLKKSDISPLILTYIHPSEKLGGNGALYLLLRRNKDNRF